jgi:hypothetical protein
MERVEKRLFDVIAPMFDMTAFRQCIINFSHRRNPENVKEQKVTVLIERAEKEEVASVLRCQVRLGEFEAISFVLEPYPACCAILQLHHFRVNDNLNQFTQEKFHTIMDAMMKELPPEIGHWSSRRLVVMMKESRKEYALSYDDEEDDRQEHQFEVISPIAKPAMGYPWFFEYFHKQKKVNTRLMWNANTGNIIHDMEVLFDPEEF